MRKRKLHVAIVDDDESVRKALARLLANHFTKIDTYGSGESFLTSIARTTPDCLILDLQMPDVSGLEVLHHMAALSRRIPTIIITAHSEQDVRARCEAAGAAGFLSKPLSYDVLIDAINRATSATTNAV